MAKLSNIILGLAHRVLLDQEKIGKNGVLCCANGKVMCIFNHNPLPCA